MALEEATTGGGDVDSEVEVEAGGVLVPSDAEPDESGCIPDVEAGGVLTLSDERPDESGFDTKIPVEAGAELFASNAGPDESRTPHGSSLSRLSVVPVTTQSDSSSKSVPHMGSAFRCSY